MANYTIIIRSVFTIHFSRKPFYDNQRDWQRIASQVATATAIQNPFTFYYVRDNDWSSTHNYDYWNKNFTSAQGANNATTLKTIYDPSISGFSLPQTAAFTGFTLYGNNTSNSGEFNVNGGFTNGWNFYTNGWKVGSSIFFYALGFRDTYSGRSTGTGAIANGENGYHTVGASSVKGGLDLYFTHNSINTQLGVSRSYGLTVCSVRQ